MSRLHGQQATESRNQVRVMPRWRQLCWVAAGLGLDWRCAFEWFAGKSPFYSELVLGRTLLIVLACAGASLLALCVTREATWRHALPLFCLLSGFVYTFLSVHWIAERR